MPGEIVPCAVFPGDDLVVVAMAADFSGAEAVTLSVTAAGSSPMSAIENAPVSRVTRELLWAIPASAVRQLPSMRLQLTVKSGGATGDVLGTYALEHSAAES